MYLTRSLKKFAISLFLIIAIFSCKKNKPKEDPQPPTPEETPSVYESIFGSPSIPFCGSAFTSYLKIQDGTDIGTVTVGNDGVSLYLTYNLTGNWYLGETHAYAGRQSSIPLNVDGNPAHKKFPGKQVINYCDRKQTFTFRVLLSALTLDNDAQCPTNERYYIAMRASVRQINNAADCGSGTDQIAWGAPFLINPGNASEWATAFFYCKQDCTIPNVCAYSQGYWFKNASQNSGWCQNVKFGSLEVTEQQGDDLWPAQTNWVKKALFQASALQLTMKCYHNGDPVPTSIASEYNRLEAFLSTLTYTDIQNGVFPITTDTTGVRTATGNIGRWICNNHCTANPDPTACTGF